MMTFQIPLATGFFNGGIDMFYTHISLKLDSLMWPFHHSKVFSAALHQASTHVSNATQKNSQRRIQKAYTRHRSYLVNCLHEHFHAIPFVCRYVICHMIVLGDIVVKTEIHGDTKL